MFSTYPQFSMQYSQYTGMDQELYDEAMDSGQLCSHLVDYDYNPLYAAGPIQICYYVSNLSLYKAPKGFDKYYMPSDYQNNNSFFYFLNDREVQDSLGVNKFFLACNGTFGDEYFPQDYWVDPRKFIVPLIEAGVKTLIYDGDLDWICNYLQEEKVVHEMVWSGQVFWGKQEFTSCPEGMCKEYLNLRYIRFAAAGHMVPSFQPQIALDMINRLLDW